MERAMSTAKPTLPRRLLFETAAIVFIVIASGTAGYLLGGLQ
jgi:hypothetical protein